MSVDWEERDEEEKRERWRRERRGVEERERNMVLILSLSRVLG